MHRYTKLLLASLTATALLALAVSSATANRLELVRNGETSIRAVWTSLRLTNTARPEGTVLCPVTLEGSFHSATISKVVGALVGYVSRASVNGASCTGGTATVNNASLPWHIRYRGFTGTLPNITSILLGLIGAEFQIRESGGQVCSAKTTVEEPAVGAVTVNATTHRVESLTPETNARIELRGGTFEICRLSRGAFGGESNPLTLLGSTAEFSIRLI